MDRQQKEQLKANIRYLIARRMQQQEQQEKQPSVAQQQDLTLANMNKGIDRVNRAINKSVKKYKA